LATPLTITEDEIDKGIHIIENTLNRLG